MFTRSFAGLVVGLGVAGIATAQQPTMGQQPAATFRPLFDAPAGTTMRPLFQNSTTAPMTTPRFSDPNLRPAGYQPPTAPPANLPGTTASSTPLTTPRAMPPGAGMPAAGMPAAGMPGVGMPTMNGVPVPMNTATPAYGSSGYAGACGPDGCDVGCATCGDCLCGPPGRTWITAEWLYYTTSGQSVPPLITSGPVGAPRASAGAIGAPGTTVLVGGNTLNNDSRNGFRVNAGIWLDPSQLFGFETGFTMIGQSHQGGAAGSPGTSVIVRPFTNALTGAQDTQLVSFPGVLAGTAVADSKTSPIYALTPQIVRNLACDPCGRLDLTVGFRYMNLNDDINIVETLSALPGSSVPNSRYGVNDRFRTENNFYGPTVGLNWERRTGHWIFGVRSSIAMGVTHQVVRIDGSTNVVNAAGTITPFSGGLLAQASNIGTYTENKFTVIPEVGARIGLQVTERTRAFVGYNFLYWSSVKRAGDQIDTRVNTNQIPPPNGAGGPALPAYLGKTNDFWAHGVSVGLEFRF